MINLQKRLKLPNGFGSISYYSDKRRRKPYVAKKYIGGKQKPVGYFDSYEAALAYLVAYNRDPSLFNASEITFAEVFRLWSAEHYPKIAKSTRANYDAAYRHCWAVHAAKFAKLRLHDLQSIINVMGTGGIGYASQKKCRQLMHNLYTYAIKYEIIPATADASRYVDIDKKVIKYPKKAL